MGLYRSVTLYRRAAILQSFERLASYTATQIRYTAAPMGDIFVSASSQSDLTPLQGFLGRFETGKDWRETFRQGIAQDFVGQGLEQADTAIISGWGEGLGSTDIPGQLEHCHRCGEQLREQAAAARQQALTKGKLYTSLGVAGGLTVALLWI